MEKVLAQLLIAGVSERSNIRKAMILFLLLFPSSLVSLAQCNLNTIVSTTAASCGGSNGKATVAVSGGAFPYKFDWSSGGKNSNETGLAPGEYTCTITDKLNCTVTVTAIVQSNPAVNVTSVITQVTCPNGTNGRIVLSNPTGGTSPYTYSWSTGSSSSTLNNVGDGTYLCTITSANGCAGVKSFTITEPAAITPTVTKTNLTCGGTDDDGEISLSTTGGTAPYTYAWNPGGATTATISNLAAGTYSCIITDSKGCTKSSSSTLIRPTGFTASIVNTNVTCKGGSDGSATVTVTGGKSPFNYAWSPTGGSNKTASNLKEGTYNVDIEDANGCLNSKIVKITAFSNISVTVTAKNVSCTSTNNGSIQLVPKNGISPYTYKWTGSSATTASRTNLTTGSYAYTVTDNAGCKVTDTEVITKDVCTEILPEANIADLVIYPNPAKDHIKIQSPTAFTMVRILDPKGRIVLEREGENEMELPQLEKGIYFVHLYGESGSIVKKLAIE